MQPSLRTARLRLRPFTTEDAPALLALISDKAVAATTLRIPHPCPPGHVVEWLAAHEQEYEARQTVRWAIVLPDGALVGGISLFLKTEFDAAELGFWVGKPYWGQGYASEAAARVLAYGFYDLGLNRVEAHFMDENRASAQVLRKLGLQFEGFHKQLVKRWGEYKDVHTYAVLREDYFSVAAGSLTI